MNERIKTLAKVAGYDEINKAAMKLTGFDPEKLAELIIRECMACSIWVGKNNTNTVEPIHTAQAINQRIKQQFRIEE